jgi:hypothetical protein
VKRYFDDVLRYLIHLRFTIELMDFQRKQSAERRQAFQNLLDIFEAPRFGLCSAMGAISGQRYKHPIPQY